MSSWLRPGLLAVVLAGSASCGDDAVPDPPEPTEESCTTTTQGLVRRSIAAIWGRAPMSQHEVSLLAARYDQLASSSGVEGANRDLVAILARDSAYQLRWADAFMDALLVPRIQSVRNAGYSLEARPSCYGAPEVNYGGAALAAWVRDNPPTATDPPTVAFGMGQLLTSALILDDLSPVYRAQLFHFLRFPLAGADVSEAQLEADRRNDLGRSFEETYLRRNPDCLLCHNSGFSTTYDPDPDANRFYPPPFDLEVPLYGDSQAVSRDLLGYRSVFRVSGVVDSGTAPWGWSRDLCGNFGVPATADPLGVETHFGSVVSSPSAPVSVWILEDSLQRGFSLLRGRQPAAEDLKDPDAALAYLVAQSVVNSIWTEVMGAPLTIATYFPRTQAQEETLTSLAGTFIESGYSLQEVLAKIVGHPQFRAASADSECWQTDYPLDPIVNPWSTDAESPDERLNSSGDLIQPRSLRVLLRRLHTAMDWPSPPAFPEGGALSFQRRVGAFLLKSEPGFRGLDFDARLFWEFEYGDCDVTRTRPDYLERLLEQGAASNASVRDVVVALKDRLVGDPSLSSSEEGLLAEAFGQPLDAQASSVDARDIRRYCGVLLASPAFLLGGVEPEQDFAPPTLQLPEQSFDSVCAALTKLEETGSFDCAAVPDTTATGEN